jgi:hypothetical protein
LGGKMLRKGQLVVRFKGCQQERLDQGQGQGLPPGQQQQQHLLQQLPPMGPSSALPGSLGLQLQGQLPWLGPQPLYTGAAALPGWLGQQPRGQLQLPPQQHQLQAPVAQRGQQLFHPQLQAQGAQQAQLAAQCGLLLLGPQQPGQPQVPRQQQQQVAGLLPSQPGQQGQRQQQQQPPAAGPGSLTWLSWRTQLPLALKVQADYALQPKQHKGTVKRRAGQPLLEPPPPPPLPPPPRPRPPPPGPSPPQPPPPSVIQFKATLARSQP